MNVIVLGGTRFIGKATVAQLVERGHAVTVFHRGITSLDKPAVRELRGDRHELQNHRGAFERLAIDVVVDMLAMTEADARQLVRTMRGIARRAVVISSMDVYRAYDVLRGVEREPLEAVPIDEHARLRSKLYPYRGETLREAGDPRKWLDDYDKILVEQVVARDPELPATVLRLPMVYGEGDYQHRLFQYLRRMDRGESVIELDEITAEWRASRGYVENVAAAIVGAVEAERPLHPIYNVADAEVFTEAEWVERIGYTAGWKWRATIVPPDRLPANRRFEGNAHQALVADTSRIRRDLGYTERVPIDVALKRTVAWERANPPPT
jgi:nucleoside-diphosphate-sugar epimerase